LSGLRLGVFAVSLIWIETWCVCSFTCLDWDLVCLQLHLSGLRFGVFASSLVWIETWCVCSFCWLDL